ncbi:hypothetical protein HDU82_007876 [Entophlyctis luteolus]|nr:hypothetical protein HDU82_007876 [Entophlyctis luteolus]
MPKWGLEVSKVIKYTLSLVARTAWPIGLGEVNHSTKAPMEQIDIAVWITSKTNVVQ